MDEYTEGQSHTKTILAVVIVVVIGLALYFFLPSLNGAKTVSPDGVVVERIDVEAVVGEDKLPPGFPVNIPVDTATIQESYTADYKDDGFTQHSISYISTDSIPSIYESYQSFMEGDGYALSDETLVDGLGSLYGAKDGNDLSVVISINSEGNLVNVSYLER